jgi:hypothetical protein
VSLIAPVGRRYCDCRTAVINQLRAFLLERGMTFAKSPAKLKLAMAEILDNADSNLTSRMRNLVSGLWTEWKRLDVQIEASNQEIEQIATSDGRMHSVALHPRHRPIDRHPSRNQRGCIGHSAPTVEIHAVRLHSLHVRARRGIASLANTDVAKADAAGDACAQRRLRNQRLSLAEGWQAACIL